jgi:hypothetical protein
MYTPINKKSFAIIPELHAAGWIPGKGIPADSGFKNRWVPGSRGRGFDDTGLVNQSETQYSYSKVQPQHQMRCKKIIWHSSNGKKAQ